MPDLCQPCRSGRCEDCRRLGFGCDCCGGDVVGDGEVEG